MARLSRNALIAKCQAPYSFAFGFLDFVGKGIERSTGKELPSPNQVVAAMFAGAPFDFALISAPKSKGKVQTVLLCSKVEFDALVRHFNANIIQPPYPIPLTSKAEAVVNQATHINLAKKVQLM